MKAKDLTFIIAIIYHEDLFSGSVSHSFEEAYKLAKAFGKKYPYEFNWETEKDHYDEAIIKFVNLNKQI